MYFDTGLELKSYEGLHAFDFLKEVPEIGLRITRGSIYCNHQSFTMTIENPEKLYSFITRKWGNNNQSKNIHELWETCEGQSEVFARMIYWQCVDYGNTFKGIEECWGYEGLFEVLYRPIDEVVEEQVNQLESLLDEIDA